MAHSIKYAAECCKIRNALPKSCLPGYNTIPERKIKREYKSYFQPSRPEPFKPKPNLSVSNECFAKSTIYNCSFAQPLCGPREKPIKRKDHITMAGEFQNKTVQQTSYLGKCAPVVKKITPKNHCLGGKGPMSFVTTTQDCFYLPCVSGREEKFKPKGNLSTYSCPMETKTVTGCSYGPVAIIAVENYKPNERYNAPKEIMDLNTVQRTSYRRVALPKKVENPWSVKLEYCKPKTEVETYSIYDSSYKEPGYYRKKDICLNVINSMLACVYEN
ncbi:Hypothetical protein CINCED_3A000474 [Cinara cedri]|uniref:Uncharacterized protein n=1 Tax=Cinara cedri TaxID=506608 RepID=A0A5E4N199_9HEMI|nr:Hypothetical protein CINCED_3A000474 [Cinara cedri]